MWVSGRVFEAGRGSLEFERSIILQGRGIALNLTTALLYADPWAWCWVDMQLLSDPALLEENKTADSWGVWRGVTFSASL